MADKLGLDYDEVVILQETSVAHRKENAQA